MLAAALATPGALQWLRALRSQHDANDRYRQPPPRARMGPARPPPPPSRYLFHLVPSWLQSCSTTLTMIAARRWLGAAGKTGGSAKKLWGTVVSDRMEKTVVVEVERWSKHPRVGKIVKHRRKFPAHDELEAARIGDRVEIEQCRPISKTKFYTMTNIVTEADFIDRANPNVLVVEKSSAAQA